MADQRPSGRKRNVTGSGASVSRRGSGLGTGPTGASGFNKNQGSGNQGQTRGSAGPVNKNPYSQGRGSAPSGGPGSGPEPGTGQSADPSGRSILGNLSGLSGMGSSLNSAGSQGSSGSGGGSRGGLLKILIPILLIIVIFFVVRGFFKGGSTQEEYYYPTQQTTAYNNTDYSSGFASYSYSNNIYGTSSADTSSSASAALADTTVASGSRAKYTNIVGGGKDVVTILVYMIASDLESESGMASADISEMTKADFGDNVNIILYTGGTKSWKNNVMSSSVNQIYKVSKGGVTCLNSNAGNTTMTSPDTLSSFIKWGAANYPADRYELILWDHGAGSVSGYGYDEKHASSGYMSLSGINTALNNGGVKFDFIGFDACLMATMETALMLDKHADYLIASEETEPGIGWYYTDWLSDLGSNTSVSTVQLGKAIVDDFITTCARKCSGQKATLSVVDLAELSYTTSSAFPEFADSVTELVSSDSYKTVSDARSRAREFAASSKIDQVDLTDLALKINNTQSQALAKAIQGAVKYNRTSSNMTNCYGLSIYFPYYRTSYVDKISATYSEIGIDESYTNCIRAFAKLESSGQASSGGSSPLSSLFGGYSSYGSDYGYSDYGYSDYSQYSSQDALSSLLESFLGGSSGYFSDRSMTVEEISDYIYENHFDPSDLTWEKSGDTYRMLIKDADLLHDIDLNLYYDDGEGFINLGLDNVFDWDGDYLVADTSRAWLALNGQIVAYFRETEIDGTITGHVTALLNGRRADIIIVFDDEHPYGYVAGATYDYEKELGDPMFAKNLIALEEGDTIDFFADYYDYDGNYLDTYLIGEQIVYNGALEVSELELDDAGTVIMYRLTDIYNQAYWTEAIRN